MKKIYLRKTKATLQLLFLSISLFVSKVSAQCPSGNAIFSTQAQVDLFINNYPNCNTISGNLYIGPGNQDPQGNITNLSSLGNLTQINGTVFIQNNALLQNLNGLKIKTIGGRLFIGGDNANNTNSKLQNIDGLSSLISVGQFLQVVNNPVLSNVNGLNNLTSVGQDIEITGNSLLSNISGLQNTSFNPNDGYGLTILNNPALAVCNLPKFCAYIANPSNTHPRNIAGNMTSCLNEVALKLACGFMSVVDIEKSNVSVYPNPTKSVLNFSEEISNIRISDISGRTVKEIPASAKSIDVTTLENGTYIITGITKTGNTITKKLVKE